jgi:ATP-dependent phosphofructokinase / diphosphate-dependent phosphofructokinase
LSCRTPTLAWHLRGSPSEPESGSDQRRNPIRCPGRTERQLHDGALDTLHSFHRLLRLVHDLAGNRASGRGERHRHLDVRSFDSDVVDEPEHHEVEVELRVLDLPQGFANLIYCNHWRGANRVVSERWVATHGAYRQDPPLVNVVGALYSCTFFGRAATAERIPEPVHVKPMTDTRERRGIRRIAINTGGGDAPGLNAVIRAATLSAMQRGWEVLGIRRGYTGLLEGEVDGEPGVMPLTAHAVRGITHLGGTILGTTTRGNPFGLEVKRPDGTWGTRDRSDEIVERFHALGIDALVAIGGDGSLNIANALNKKGLPVIGVPKTIDNDLAATDMTFGFQTAVEVATDAIGRLHSTAEAHQRAMVVEVMGRHTGWIALESGLAGGADVIIIPEIPFDSRSIARKVRERDEHGRRFSIIVIAEGSVPAGGEPSYADDSGRYGGIAERLAREIEEETGKETRSLVLGHIQRGGTPIAYDRNLALRFGAAAVRCIQEGNLGTMVALRGGSIRPVPLADAVRELKRVPLDSDQVLTARQLGVSLGD